MSIKIEYINEKVYEETKKKEKDWHIEPISKMNNPAGKLANGKQYFMQAHHPAHKTFTPQEHMEAAKHLHDKGRAMWDQGHDQDDMMGANSGRGLVIAAKSHAEKAKAMGGMPPHNNPPKS